MTQDFKPLTVPCDDLQRLADLERDFEILLRNFAVQEHREPLSRDFERMLWRRGLLAENPDPPY